MSVQQRIIPQENPLKGLDDLMWVVNNPKEYKKAQEIIRAQAQLTAEAQAQLDEAKAFIADYEAKKKEIESATVALEADKEEFEKEVVAWRTEATAREEDIAAQRGELQKITATQDEVAKAQAQTSRELQAYKKQLDDDYANKLKELVKREQAIETAVEVNNAEAGRLAELRQKFEAKAALYKQAETV